MQPDVSAGPAFLYPGVLGDAFVRLHPFVQRAHVPPLVARGSFDVEHGSHPLTPILIALLRLPASGAAQPLHLDVAAMAGALTWTRRIGTRVLRTQQHARGTRMVEVSGPGRLEFEVRVHDGALDYRLVDMRVARVRVPLFIRPHVAARVSAAPNGWQVEVTVTWRDHLVCRYGGVMHAT